MKNKRPLLWAALGCTAALLVFLVVTADRSVPKYESLALRNMSSSASGKAWMWLTDNNHELVAAVGPDLPPFVYVNRQGQLTGLLYDYLTILEKRLGCHFRIVPYMNPATLVTLLREKRVSLVLDLQMGELHDNLLASKEISTAPIGIYANADMNRAGPYSLQDLSGKRVSMSVHSASYNYVRDNYPDIILDPAADCLNAVTRLAAGISDFALLNVPSAEHFIKELNFSSLTHAGSTGLNMRLALGVRSDVPELAELVFSTLASITEEQHGALVARRLPPSWKNVHFYTQLLPLFGVLLAATLSGMGLFYLWTHSLRRQVRIKSTLLREELALRRDMEMLLLHSAKVEAMGSLTGGIYHDLNNIMTVIAGYAELNCTVQSEAEWRKNTAKMAFAAGQAKSILERLLSFLRREPEKKVARPLMAFLEDCLDFLKGLLPEGVTIQRHILVPDDLVTDVDNALLMQMIINLCTNAADAMDGKGTIAVEAYHSHSSSDGQGTPCAAPPVPVASHVILPRPSGPCVTVSVADTGPGIDEADLPLIFEPFFTTKPAGKGTGMGLAIVHGILARVRGGLHIATSPAGTRFTLYLPIRHARETTLLPEDSARPRPAQTEPAGPEQAVDVLIVHTDAAAASRVSGHCDKWGYNAATAKCGREALERVTAMGKKSRGPRLALVRLPLPDMTPEELANALYVLDAALPVVLWSEEKENTDTDNMPNVVECVSGALNTRELARLVRLFRE